MKYLLFLPLVTLNPARRLRTAPGAAGNRRVGLPGLGMTFDEPLSLSLLVSGALSRSRRLLRRGASYSLESPERSEHNFGRHSTSPR